MSVLEQVRADVIRAMKAGEKDTAGALRLLASELQKDTKEGKGDELAVLRRERKRRLDAAAQFDEGGRSELADKERSEAALIEGYLPPELDDAALDAIVADAVRESGASSPKQMGAVMKLVMSRTNGQVDGKRAQAAVRKALT
ncbi:MAG: GatB/YqeY domain-containing protein [Solirubrobacterales bacterium]|nr:GatB/YqeY domain-containing protein [Solirubrobacterales bacterium]